MKLYLETYGDKRTPHRIVFGNREDAIKDVEFYGQMMNVSISPWYFTEVQKSDKRGGALAPVYESAVVNKLFFDIDVLDSKGELDIPAIESVDRLWNWASKHNYKRECAFTGGGYQIFIGCKINTLYYFDIMTELRKQLNLNCDRTISLQQMRRYVGSYNYGNLKKSERRNYCIDLTENELCLPFSKHRELSMKRRTTRYKFGTELYTTAIKGKERYHNIIAVKTDLKSDATVDQILDKYGLVTNDICPYIRQIIAKPHVGHFERLIVIKYLKTICFINYADMRILLPKLLSAPHDSGTDGSHAISEGQVDAIYRDNLHFDPNWAKDNDICNPNCMECQQMLERLKKL